MSLIFHRGNIIPETLDEPKHQNDALRRALKESRDRKYQDWVFKYYAHVPMFSDYYFCTRWDEDPPPCDDFLTGFSWIHFPETNAIALSEIFRRAVQRLSLKDEMASRLVRAQTTKAFQATLDNDASRPGDANLCYRSHTYISRTETYRDTQDYTVSHIVFPCLMLQNSAAWQVKQKEYRSLKQSIAKTLSQDKSDESSVHIERTLDEAYFPRLRSDTLRKRNEHQVVSREHIFMMDEGMGEERMIRTFPDLVTSARINLHKVAGEIGQKILRLPASTLNYLQRVVNYTFGLVSLDQKQTTPGEDVTIDERAPILIVPQLWIWRLGGLVLSAHAITTATESFGCKLPEDYRLKKQAQSILQSMEGDKKKWFLHAAQIREHPTPTARYDPQLQIATIIAEFIDLFGQSRVEGQHKYLPTLDYFEIGLNRILSDVEKYVGDSDYKSLRFGREADFLLHIADIKTELAMIQEILSQQQEILGLLIADCEESLGRVKAAVTAAKERITLEEAILERSAIDGEQLREAVRLKEGLRRAVLLSQDSIDRGAPVKPPTATELRRNPPKVQPQAGEPKIDGLVSATDALLQAQLACIKPAAVSRKIMAAQQNLVKHIKATEKINKDAGMIENIIKDQLELKRSYTAIRDARASLAVAVSVIGFTVVTMIFTPLSFITGLFQLPLVTLARTKTNIGNSSDTAYRSKEVAKWFATTEIASLAVTIAVSVLIYLWFLHVHDQPDDERSEMNGKPGPADAPSFGSSAKVRAEQRTDSAAGIVSGSKTNSKAKFAEASSSSRSSGKARAVHETDLEAGKTSAIN